MDSSEMNEEQDYYYEEDDEVEYYAVRPNKTRIKKEIAALFDLGEELSQLSPAVLETFELPENVRKSVLEVAGMPHKGARKRLLKYIAGQLHKIEVEPILEKLARIKNQSAHGIREHHLAERWRDRLIQGNNDDLAELLDTIPAADSQHLRQLMRNAQKEAAAMKPPKSARLLYRYLKELVSGPATASMETEEEQDEDE